MYGICTVMCNTNFMASVCYVYGVCMVFAEYLHGVCTVLVQSFECGICMILYGICLQCTMLLRHRLIKCALFTGKGLLNISPSIPDASTSIACRFCVLCRSSWKWRLRPALQWALTKVILISYSIRSDRSSIESNIPPAPPLPPTKKKQTKNKYRVPNL